MKSRRILAVLCSTLLLQLGASCSTLFKITVTEPTAPVDTFSFDMSFDLGAGLDPASVAVELNGVSILDRFSGGPTHFTATIDPGAPLRDQNQLKITADKKASPGQVGKIVDFDYLPPGKARAVEIDNAGQLIRGPLAHSRIGDWLLENSDARFVIQDVGQRELYSVGQFGGNIIDAELVGNPGKDNWLEIQPSLNIESVVNAQTVEVVNDGQDGTAAIIRTCGPDDLLDFVNPSSQVADFGFPFPAISDDNDLEIEGCTSYTLEPRVDPAAPQTFVRVDTEVFNNDNTVANPLRLSVGDWVNPGGELDTVARSVQVNGTGPPVSSTVEAVAFPGYDEGAGTDYSLVQATATNKGTFVFISGVLVVLHSDNVLLALIGVAPKFQIPFEGSNTFTRYMGVGDGSGSSAIDIENAVNGTPTGVLEGCISVGGTPVQGAKVSVGTDLLSATATQLASQFATRAGSCPNYSGTLPGGTYDAAAALKGHLYEGGAATPALHPVTITVGATTALNVDLTPAGSLLVNVTDEGGSPIPARVTVVGFDPSPLLLRESPELPGFGTATLGLFEDNRDRVPFGITSVGYADASGTAQFDVEPGVGLYHVYVTRGTEYSAFRTAAPVTITSGAQTVINAQIARVVDTTGFISSDFHVHGIRSADSRVSDIHRVESYSAEGVENVIMTDHHVHTDLKPAIAAAGMSAFVTATIGEEMTTFDYGHFNGYPFLLDPASPHATFTPDGLTQLSGGSTDWGGAAPPGFDFPEYGAFSATPAEIHSLAITGPLSTASTTVQINHIDSHFVPLKIDTSLVPPADGMTDLQRAGRRLPSTTAVPNLFHSFPALELWNGDNRNDQAQFLDERIGIWFNLLNQGLDTTFIADTDSHTFTDLNTAGARTWTASPVEVPALIDPADVAAAVEAGRAVGGQGVYVQTRLLATDLSGDVADLTLGGKTNMTDAAGNVQLEIHVQSPNWARWNRIEIYRNAPTTPTVGSPYLFGATPDRVLDEGDCDPTTTGDGDFDVTVVPDVGGVTGADRLEATLVESFNALTADTWFVVVVKGTDGVCPPMYPVYPDSLAQGANLSLADLTDGNLGEAGVMALGATNALYYVEP